MDNRLSKAIARRAKQEFSSIGDDKLAERLEKSEAGRKKLRQAISILQEKLASSEELLKANDDLRKECEQERQRAENEKKNAEEEKRLRVLLEKDSATVKDQLAKVFQRLGAVEKKQKIDKKQVERLQNEVKLSVEGMRIAAEAVDAVQSSLQDLETKLLEKVDAAFKEACTASVAVNQLQASVQSLQNSVVKKGSLADNQLPLSATNLLSEKLVDEISHLFRKEKQSHCKIEQKLSKLRSVLKYDPGNNSLTTAEDSDLEKLAYSKMDEGKVLKKRKPGGKEEELLNWKARKRLKVIDMDVVNSVATRSSVDVAKEVHDGRSMSSPFSTECQMTSEERPHVPNTASNEYMGEAIINHRGSSNGMAHVQIQSVGGKAQKGSRRSPFTRRDNVDSGSDVIKGCFKGTCLQTEGIPKIQSDAPLHVMQHGNFDQLAGEGDIHGRGLNACRSNADMPMSVQINSTDDTVDLELSFDDSDDEWWSQRVLLSPSLPEIPSPVHHSPFCIRDPSLLKTDAYIPDTTLDLDSSDIPENDSHALTEAATRRTSAQGVDTQGGCYPVAVCLEQLEVSLQKDITVSSSRLQPGSCSRVIEEQNKSGANCQIVHAEKHIEMASEGVQQNVQLSPPAGICASDSHPRETQSSFQEACPSIDPFSASITWLENFLLPDEEVSEREFELSDSAIIAEIDKLLEVLPPIHSTLSIEPCALELLQVNTVDAKTCELLGLSNESCISNLPHAASEMPTLGAVSIKDSKAIYCITEASRDSLLQNTNLSQNESCISNLPHAAPEMPALGAVSIKDSKAVYCITEASSESLQQNTNLSQNASAQILPIQEGSQAFEATKDRETHSVSSSTKPSTSTVIFLLQAFDLQGADAELDVIAACVMAINFKGYLRATTVQKEEMQLQRATFAMGCASVPIEYVACSLISVVFDMMRLGNGEEHCNSEAKPSFVLLHELVAFIKMVFKELAISILDTTFAQLSRFLVEGKGMLMTLHGAFGLCEDVLSSARVFQEQKHHSHHYSEATLEDIYVGGKVLAALCQILSCVTHLQNVVYEVLGWCDKDVIWLLTVFSSFSSICGNSAFIVEADDILGHAICAIIVELVASVEQESIETAEVSNCEATTQSANVSSNLSLEWSTLKGSLESIGDMSVEQVVLAVFKALGDILSSAHDSLAGPSMENKLVWAKECHNNEKKRWQGSDFSKENVETPVSYQVSSVGKTMQKALSERPVDAVREGVKKWQKKYGDAVGALQLILQFMGWEWAYNHLVIRCLSTEAIPGSAQHSVAVHILSILWRMGVQGGGTNLPGLAELKKCLVHIAQFTLINFKKFEQYLSAEECAWKAR